MAQQFTGLLDMFNGGGAGQAGAQFEGGLFSGLLNGMGVKPIGQGGAQAAAQASVPAPEYGQRAAFNPQSVVNTLTGQPQAAHPDQGLVPAPQYGERAPFDPSALISALMGGGQRLGGNMASAFAPMMSRLSQPGTAPAAPAANPRQAPAMPGTLGAADRQPTTLGYDQSLEQINTLPAHLRQTALARLRSQGW